MTKKKIFGILFILCLTIGIFFLGNSIYNRHICSVYDVKDHQCYECSYSNPIFIGESASNRCVTRIIKKDCDKKGFWSIPNDYDDRYHWFDCEYRATHWINEGLPMNRLPVTFQNTRSIIIIFTGLLIIIFIPFWLIKKIRKKCWGYSVIKVITCIQITIALFAIILGHIMDYYVRRDAANDAVYITEYKERNE